MSLAASLAAGHGAPALGHQVQITLAEDAPEVVWRYKDPGAPCQTAINPTTYADYADVPVRPFLVNGATAHTYRVLWFAANSKGYFASETAGPDVAPADITLEHFKRRPHCRRWVHSKSYKGSLPDHYYTGLWMVAPFTTDGANIYALVHNEFHGEWTGSNYRCAVQNNEISIHLPCDYWNLVSAFSTDGGRNFALRQMRRNWNQPAIALADRYRPNWFPDHKNHSIQLPQGMGAQTNIIEQNGFAYVLAQQIGTRHLVPAADMGRTCLFRAPVPLTATSNWQGWGGADAGWINLPASYPTAPQPPPCAPVLKGMFRFSWSFNPALGQFILIGLNNRGAYRRQSCPAADPTVRNSDEAFVYATATADLPKGKFTMVTWPTCLLRINWFDRWGKNLPTKVGAAYPSLLDPTSPTLQPGGGTDLNFQYSGSQPYLYYTRLNSFKATGNLNDRDVVRWQLSVSTATAAAQR